MGEELAQAVGVIGLVGDEALDRASRGQQRRCQRDVVDVARRK
jgi:hypothetical protein